MNNNTFIDKTRSSQSKQQPSNFTEYSDLHARGISFFSSFYRVYDFYFPHLKVPSFFLLHVGQRYTVITQIFGMVVESNRSFVTENEAYNYFGNYIFKLILEYVKMIKNSEDIEKQVNKIYKRSLIVENFINEEEYFKINKQNEEKGNEPYKNNEDMKIETYKSNTRKEIGENIFKAEMQPVAHNLMIDKGNQKIKAYNKTNSSDEEEMILDKYKEVFSSLLTEDEKYLFVYTKDKNKYRAILVVNKTSFFGGACETKTDAADLAFTMYISSIKQENNTQGQNVKKNKIEENINKASSLEILNEEVDTPFRFSKCVNDVCSTKNLPFPEYLIEKQNDVYICKAVFLGQNFTSTYHYSKENAKEHVSSKMFSYLTDNQTLNNHRNKRNTSKRQNNRQQQGNRSNNEEILIGRDKLTEKSLFLIEKMCNTAAKTTNDSLFEESKPIEALDSSSKDKSRSIKNMLESKTEIIPDSETFENLYKSLCSNSSNILDDEDCIVKKESNKNKCPEKDKKSKFMFVKDLFE